MPTPEEFKTMDMQATIDRLRGTLRYIAAQAKARHPGALEVIQANAESALEDGYAKVRAEIGKR